MIAEITQRYQKIFPMTLRVNAGGEVEYASPAFLQFTGIARGRFPFMDFFIPDSRFPATTAAEVFCRARAGQVLLFLARDRSVALRGELIEERDGAASVYFLLCSPNLSWMTEQGKGQDIDPALFPLQDNQRETFHRLRALEVVNQVQEQKLQALVQENARALTASQKKSRFVSHISHELRTPLNGIISSLRLVAGEHKPVLKNRLIDIALRSSLVLLDVVNEVLDYSKIEQGAYGGGSAPVRIRELFQSIESALQSRASERGILLVFEVAGEVPDSFVSDRKALLKIFNNLIGNAINYSDSDVIICSVAVSRKTDAECTLMFRVEDFGVGIRPQAMEKLFVPYWSDDQGQAMPTGTGLGLPIVKDLVERLGGHIRCESSVGEGSAFYFQITVRIAHVHALPTSPHGAEIADHRLRGTVLVVDDNAINAEVARHMLERLGLTVSVCLSGAEAIQAVRDRVFDILFLDISMPEMDGIAVTAVMRNLPAYRHAPIIAMTANVGEADRQRYLAAGMDDVLAKPIEPPELSAILRQYLPTETDGKRALP
ncbi:MAG: response regulator [Pseudomonadales bacterium]|nr:response regulator [Pseudomonadales bacterium]